MNRQKKEKNLLESGVIDEEAMLAYLNNELDAQQKQRFENLLAKDPFAQEAFEGLRASQVKMVNEKLSSIHKKVRERAGGREKQAVVFHWSNYAWAAVLLTLLIGIGGGLVLYLGRQDSKVAVNTESQTEQPNLFENKEELKSTGIPSPSADTARVVNISSADSSVLSVSKNEVTTQAGLTGQQEITTKGKELTPTASFTTTASNKSEPTASVPAKPSAPTDATKPAGEKKAETKTTATVTTTQKVMRGGVMEREEADKANVVTMDEAMKNFNSGKYKEAGEMFDAILQQQPANADALYFGGMSEYINGNLKRSEKNFDKLLKDGTKYSDGSKWYKANILLQKGKRDEAKKLLDELSQSGGSYKERAIKKKAELEF